VELELKGMTEIAAKLEKARIQINGPETYKALRRGARVIKAAMEEAAPVLGELSLGGLTSLPPGALKAGIRVYVPQNTDPPEALIGPNADVEHVARWVEYGHRQVTGGSLDLLGGGRTRGSGKAGVDVPAYPFLRPAYEGSTTAAEAEVIASFKESFKEVLK
jgi:hypothetical protein